MSHIYLETYIHLLFSTKDRQKFISKEFQPRLWAYLAAICKEHDSPASAIGGTEDHVHLLFRLAPTMSLEKAVKLVKSNSSKWIREHRTKFAWQRSYAGFSVGRSDMSALIKYVESQEEFHRKLTYEQEIVALLERHSVPYDLKLVLE
jgi:REP element-mobilizing transposase RayT